MSAQIRTRLLAGLTILLASLSAAAAAEDSANGALPVSCNTSVPEGGERLMRKLKVSAQVATADSQRVISVKLVNRAKSPALAAKITLVDALGQPVMPATYSDNCVTVSRGEPTTISIRYPATFTDPVALRVDGWNVKTALARIPDEAWSPPYLPQIWQQPAYTPPAPAVKSATVVVPKK